MCVVTLVIVWVRVSDNALSVYVGMYKHGVPEHKVHERYDDYHRPQPFEILGHFGRKGTSKSRHDNTLG